MLADEDGAGSKLVAHGPPVETEAEADSDEAASEDELDKPARREPEDSEAAARELDDAGLVAEPVGLDDGLVREPVGLVDGLAPDPDEPELLTSDGIDHGPTGCDVLLLLCSSSFTDAPRRSAPAV